MLAAVRGNEVNLPLFIHVLGAVVLTGALFTVALTSFMGWRGGDETVGLRRLSFKSILLGVFPGYLLMRIGAEWTAEKEGLGDSEVSWLNIGYITADLGLLFVIISMMLAGIGLRKLGSENGLLLSRAAGVIATLLVVAYVVATWAMTTKPV